MIDLTTAQNALKDAYLVAELSDSRGKLFNKTVTFNVVTVPEDSFTKLQEIINNASVHTREIFREAYLLSAATIVCLHNHPSNDTTPSKEDINFTDKLMRTGYIQGIPVVDHIIVGEDTYYSFYQNRDILNL